MLDSAAPILGGIVGVFAAVAMLLSSIGIYGLLAYMVGRGLVNWNPSRLGSPGPDILKLISAKGYCSPVLEIAMD